MKSSVLVIGGGAAALCAAIEACEAGCHVALVSKSFYKHASYVWRSEGGCSWKAHGFNVAISKDDSVANHIRDTLEGGYGAGDPLLVEALCYGSVELVEWLKSLGVKFEFSPTGEIALKPFGGCGTSRAVFKEDRLGFYIQAKLMERIQEFISKGSIVLIENARAIRLLEGDGRVLGATIMDTSSLHFSNVYAGAVIIADGGGAAMYSPSAVSSDKTCDGLRMALDLGCGLVDMEYVQFHPTGLASKVLPFDGALVEEILRFDGAFLLNKEGERFMFKYSSLGEKATRDQVSIAIYTELLEGRGVCGDAVWLDISKCIVIIKNNYPALLLRLRQAGFDLDTTAKIAVRPTAHFLMGGVLINRECETEVDGLYFAGESAGGVHGANRLGGNGFSEALVFGRRAGKSAADFALGNLASLKVNEYVDSFNFPFKVEGISPVSLLNKLRYNMYWYTGPVRDRGKLLKMLKIITCIEESYDKISILGGAMACDQVKALLDLKNLAFISKVITQAALNRNESRGAHARSDYPFTADSYKRQIAFQREGAVKIKFVKPSWHKE